MLGAQGWIMGHTRLLVITLWKTMEIYRTLAFMDHISQYNRYSPLNLTYLGERPIKSPYFEKFSHSNPFILDKFSN